MIEYHLVNIHQSIICLSNCKTEVEKIHYQSQNCQVHNYLNNICLYSFNVYLDSGMFATWTMDTNHSIIAKASLQ